MNNFKPEWIIVHCAATPPSLDGDARWVDRVHRQKGWNGGGYHEVITRPGERQNRALGFPTRPITRPGAHVGGCGVEWNRKTLGICLIGGVDEKGDPEDNFTPPQIEALLEAIREYQEMFDIPDERVIGHRDLIRMTKSSPKACPCMSVQALLTRGKKRHGGWFNFKNKTDALDTLFIQKTHKVRKGETLWGISAAYGIPIKELEKLNDIKDGSLIRTGTTLKLQW